MITTPVDQTTGTGLYLPTSFDSPGSQSPRDMLVHEECRITCHHRHSLWYLTGSLDCGLSRNAIRQWLVHDFVPMSAASRIEASASLSGESRTLHSTTCCHTAECSPCIALAQCALGCKPQMCGRLLQEGCNQDQTCVPHRACAPPRRNKAQVKATGKAEPGMAGAIHGGPLRVGWADFRP